MEQSTPTSRRQPSRGRFVIVTALIAVVLVAVTVIATILVTTDDPANKELARVNPNKYQAVFLDGGQVYFGKITNLTSGFIELTQVFYLNVKSTSAQTNSNSKVSLVKLGCELHGPDDQMIIKTANVSFWENLKSDSKVTSAINTWKSQNPNGQNCSTESSTTDQAPTTTTQ